MADPQKLPSGNWRIQWLDAYGKRKSETFSTERAARAAQRRRGVEVDDIRSGLARPRSELTLREAAAQWLATRRPDPKAAPDVHDRQAARFRDNSQHFEDHILPRLGDLRLPEITVDEARAFVKRLEGTPKKSRRADADTKTGPGTLRPSTVRNVVVTLRKLLGDLGYPIRISVKVPRAGYDWIRTGGEVVRFLDACGDGWFRVVASLAVYAGLRTGEVAALTWHAIDFDREVMVIDKSWSGPTKSGKPRTVPLAPELAVLLKRWRLTVGGASKDRVVLRARTRKVDGDAVVTLEPLNDSDLAKRTRAVCAKAKINGVTYHQLRHTFATMIAERMPLPAVRELLGHADITTTARYAHADSATAARDQRARLSFGAEAGGEVVELHPAAHVVHTATKTGDPNA